MIGLRKSVAGEAVTVRVRLVLLGRWDQSATQVLQARLDSKDHPAARGNRAHLAILALPAHKAIQAHKGFQELMVNGDPQAIQEILEQKDLLARLAMQVPLDLPEPTASQALLAQMALQVLLARRQQSQVPQALLDQLALQAKGCQILQHLGHFSAPISGPGFSDCQKPAEP
jgi:hypothetical protein